MHPEGPATGHLDTGFLGFPLCLSKCWYGSQVPSYYWMILMQPSRLKLIKIYPLTVEATKLLNLPNYNFDIHQYANQNSTVSVIKLSLLTTLTSSLLLYTYQKDERALPGSLLTIRCSFSPPPPSHFSPNIFSLLLLFCCPSELSLSLSLFGFKGLETNKIQDDRKVTQSILKYLLLVAIKYNSIWLINTQYRCDYTRAHAGYVMLQPARASPSAVFQQSKCKDVFFTSATSVHCWTQPGISFLLNLPEWV
jgi:hypothetical protein